MRNGSKLLFFLIFGCFHILLCFLATFAPTNYYYVEAFGKGKTEFEQMAIAMIALLVFELISFVFFVISVVVVFQKVRSNLDGLREGDKKGKKGKEEEKEKGFEGATVKPERLGGNSVGSNIYGQRATPFNRDTKENIYLFIFKHPTAPSNIFDNSKSFYIEERQYYFSILEKYGKLVYCKNGLFMSDSPDDPFSIASDKKLSDPVSKIDLAIRESKINKNMLLPKNIDNVHMHRLTRKYNNDIRNGLL